MWVEKLLGSSLPAVGDGYAWVSALAIRDIVAQNALTGFSQKLKKLMSYSSYSKTQTHEFELLRNELSLS